MKSLLEGVGFGFCLIGGFYLSAWAAGEWMRQYWKHRGPNNINVNWNPTIVMQHSGVSPKDSSEKKEEV